MNTCPLCLVQWSGNHNCTHTPYRPLSDAEGKDDDS